MPERATATPGTRRQAPDANEYERFICPFHAGLLYNRKLKLRRRPGRTAPTAALAPGTTRCCSGSITVPINKLPLWQRIPAYTTAHRIRYGRRQIVEKVNAAIKGQFVNLDRHFIRVFGTNKIEFLLAFTLAGCNVECARAFGAHHRQVLPASRVYRKASGFAA